MYFKTILTICQILNIFDNKNILNQNLNHNINHKLEKKQKLSNLKSKNHISTKNAFGKTIVTAYKLEAIQSLINEVFDQTFNGLQSSDSKKQFNDINNCENHQELQKLPALTWKDDSHEDSVQRPEAVQRENSFVDPSWKLGNKNPQSNAIKDVIEKNLLSGLMGRTHIVRGSGLQNIAMNLKVESTAGVHCTDCAKIKILVEMDLTWVDIIQNEKWIENAGNKANQKQACLVWKTVPLQNYSKPAISQDLELKGVNGNFQILFSNPKILFSIAPQNSPDLSATENVVNGLTTFLTSKFQFFLDIFMTFFSNDINQKMSSVINNLTFLDGTLKMWTQNVAFDQQRQKIMMKLGIIRVGSHSIDNTQDVNANKFNMGNSPQDNDYILARLNGRAIWEATDKAFQDQIKIHINNNSGPNDQLQFARLGEFNELNPLGGNYQIQFHEPNKIHLKVGLMCTPDLSRNDTQMYGITTFLTALPNGHYRLLDLEIQAELNTTSAKNNNLEVNNNIKVIISSEYSWADKIVNKISDWLKKHIATKINKQIKDASILNHTFKFEQLQVFEKSQLEIKFKFQKEKSGGFLGGIFNS